MVKNQITNYIYPYIGLLNDLFNNRLYLLIVDKKQHIIFEYLITYSKYKPIS